MLLLVGPVLQRLAAHSDPDVSSRVFEEHAYVEVSFAIVGRVGPAAMAILDSSGARQLDLV